MFGIDDALIGAGVSAFANLFGGRQQNQAQQDLSSAQMAFQERLSNTAYQRQVEDLKAAGLSPMLAFMKGSAGASTPVGSMAQLTNPYASATEGFARSLASSGSSAQSFAASRLSDAQIGQVESTVDKIKQETKNLVTEGQRLYQTLFLLSEQEALTRAQGYSEIQRRLVLEQTVKKLKSETSLLDFDVQAASQLDNLGREYGQLKPIIDTVIRVLGAKAR